VLLFAYFQVRGVEYSGVRTNREIVEYVWKKLGEDEKQAGGS